jgi:riboflavin kinase/FMN adenylyltransferase
MQVVSDLNNLKEKPCRTVLTIGNFDGVHLGHREVFRRVVDRARKLQGTAAVVTFEPHPLHMLAPEKAPLRLNTPEEKVRLLTASCIDLLVILNFTQQLAEMSAEDFVRNLLVDKLGVKHLIIGYDYAFGRNRQGNASFLEEKSREYGFTLEVLEPIRAEQQVHSSTAIREILKEGRVADAVNVLGRNFTLDGVVVHGDGRGRKLGFPTANLSTEKEILPCDGVYAVKVKWCDRYYDGVINIGHRPTFAGSKTTLEIHILDFQGDLYAERLRIYFVERLRGEQKFDSVEALQEAVLKDIERARVQLAEAQVVEYREYLDCGYVSATNGVT